MVAGAERVLAWHCRRLLGRQRSMMLATASREGLPHLAQVAYRQEGDDLYVLVAPTEAVAGDLSAIGPVAGLLPGGDGQPVLHLSGAAEAVSEPAERERIAALFTTDTAAVPADAALYRVITDELRPRAGTLEARPVAPGESILRQGESPDRFYLILEGQCEVVQDGARGRETLATLDPGRFFGETGLLSGVPRTASVVATTPTTVLALNRATFAAALGDIAPTAADLARTLYEIAQS
jgi:Cyclic nucleotide-binding domain/Pyridoxamine 5'-phosphate oxidase